MKSSRIADETCFTTMKFMSGGVNSVKSLLTLLLFILGNVQMLGINF